MIKAKQWAEKMNPEIPLVDRLRFVRDIQADAIYFASALVMHNDAIPDKRNMAGLLMDFAGTVRSGKYERGH